MKKMFAGCLSPSSSTTILPAPDLPSNKRLVDRKLLFDPAQELERDAALINLEGDGASDAAKIWAESGKVKRKLGIMLGFLEDEGQKSLVEGLLRGMAKNYDTTASEEPIIPSSDTGIQTDDDVWKSSLAIRPQPKVNTPPTEPRQMKESSFQGRASIEQTNRAMNRLRSARSVIPRVYLTKDSDEETDDEGKDDNGRTAHILFAQSNGRGSQVEDPFGYGEALSSVGNVSVRTEIEEERISVSSTATATPKRRSTALPTSTLR